MEVTEYERHQLFAWFEEHLGRERAATMMNVLPPSDFATRSDLDALRSDLLRTLGIWLFASQAGVIAALGLLLGLTH